MTMTLSPQTETLLLAIASQRGLSPEETLSAVLLEAENEFQEAVADVRASQDDFAAGRSISLEEYHERVLARRQLRSTSFQNNGS